MVDRNGLIDYGFKNNKSVKEMNSALAKAGQSSLGPIEEGLYRTGKWGLTPIQRLKENALEFAQGINTISTGATELLGKVAKDPQGTLSNVAKTSADYLGKKGYQGAIEDVLSLWGQPYGLTKQDIETRGLGNVLRTLPGYIWSNPGFATLDLALPLMGRIPKHQVGDLLAKVNAPETIRNFIPSTQISKVNEAINAGKGIVSATDRAMMRELSSATNMKDVDMGQVARNLQAPTRGIWEGNEATLKATEKMRDIARKYNEELTKLGVDSSKARDVAKAQYIFESINPDRSKPIVLNDVAEAIATGNNKPLNRLGISNDNLATLSEVADRLYDQGIITPLSHRATFLRDERFPGLVTQEDRMKDVMADRRYGFATPKELGPTLFKAYEQTAKNIYDAKMGRVSLSNIAQSIGEKTTVEKLRDGRPLLPSEIVISPRAYADKVGKDFNKGNWTSTPRRINEMSSKGLSASQWNKYKDDLWVVKRDDLRPLKNMANSQVWNNPYANALRRLNSTWKTAQLITPKYIAENRLGNWSLNSIEGVTLKDYLDSANIRFGGKDIYKGKYSDIKPERLKADTSYYGVLGEEFQGAPVGQATRQAVGTISQGWKDRDWKQIVKGLYDLPTAPVLSLESGLESMDRYANFLRQAKRLSEKTGESVENILKRSAKDNELYNQLMGKVNRSLGDYIGRNWAINPEMYEGLSMAFPFFKYPTQAVRTLTHQAMNRPINFASVVTIPERIGQNIWDRQLQKYPEIADQEGGIVTAKVPGRYGYTHLHQADFHPLGAGASLIASGLSDWERINLNPIFSLRRIPDFKDRFGNPASSPNYFNYGGRIYNTDSQGKPLPEIANPGFGDRLSYFGSWVGNTFVPPVIAWNRYLGPTTATILDKTWYPNYDTSILGQIGEGRFPRGLNWLISGKSDRPGKRNPDTIINQFGVRTIKAYPKQSVGAKTYRGMMKKFQRNKMMKNFKED